MLMHAISEKARRHRALLSSNRLDPLTGAHLGLHKSATTDPNHIPRIGDCNTNPLSTYMYTIDTLAHPCLACAGAWASAASATAHGRPSRRGRDRWVGRKGGRRAGLLGCIPVFTGFTVYMLVQPCLRLYSYLTDRRV